MLNRKFGLLQPKDNIHITKYSLRALPTPAYVEVKLPYPKKLIGWYDQKDTNACGGFSASWMSTINNTSELSHPARYIPQWLYEMAKHNDGYLDPSADRGTTLRAIFDVLRKFGHIRAFQFQPSLVEGIVRNEWALDADQARTALAKRVPVVFGLPWYEKFMYPEIIDEDYWIGWEDNWGNVLGGHAICCIGASDKREAFLLLNSWGKAYPPVWIPYKAIDRLLSDWGECCIPIDRYNKHKFGWD